MLLQRLLEYSTRIPSTPTMYVKMAIKWIIDIDMEGKFQGMVSTSDGGKRNDRGKEFFSPFIGRSSGVKAKLLADNGEYVLCKAREDADKNDVLKRNKAFIELVKKAVDATSEQAVQAVLKFYENTNPPEVAMPEAFDPSQNLTFRVNGILPINLPSVQKFWAQYAESTGSNEGKNAEAKDVMQCLICGEEKTAVRRLPFKIKRIPNGQTSGMALISANSPAFESYGLEESLIAPTCQECGEKFSKAANALIEGENTHISIGPLVYIFWTKEETGFSFASILSKPEPGEVQALIESAFGGHHAATKLDVTPFYATAFSASGARVAVRDWLDTTVEGVRQNLARYFKLQQLVEGYGDKGKPIGLYALAACTVRDANKELAPNVPKALLHCALKGGPLPKSLLFQAVKRNRAEQTVTRPRAALVKMVLLSQNTSIEKEDKMEQLDLTNKEPAYLCGRLLGVLEAVQRAAMHNPNTTIVDRFYGTASSAPASVFGRLLRGVQPHLGKLRKDKRGTFEALEKKLEEVQSGLKSFPKTLTLEEQGLFALGYYHQRASDRAGAAAYILKSAR